MKAKIFVLGNQEELVVGSKNYSVEDFENRQDMIEAVELETGETLEVKEITLTDIKKKTTAALLVSVESTTGLENEMIKKVLSIRGQLPGEASKAVKAGSKEETKPSNKKASTSKKETSDITKGFPLKAKKSEKAETKTKAEKASETEKKEVKRKAVTAEDLEKCKAAAEEAKANIGKNVSFLAFKTGEKFDGVIKSVWIDKRYAVALYAIRLENGTKKNKVVHSEELTIKKGKK